MEQMHPWYKGFSGTILPNDREPGKYEVTGTIRKLNDTTVEITELPVKSWTQSYKEFLEELMPKETTKKGEDESDHLIEEFREYHTESTVHFQVTMKADKLRQAERAGLEKTFKLKGSIATSNMVLFDAEGKIARYNSSLDILREFAKSRRQMYVMRKAYLVAKLTRETEILSNKARFILMVVKGELEIRRKKKADLLKELKDLKFTPMSQLDAIMKGKTSMGLSEDQDSGQGKDESSAPEKSEYDYLLNMNLWSLTFEKVEEIKKQLEVKKQELDVLQKTTVETMWDRDLEALLKALDEMDALEEEEALAAQSAAEGRKRKRGQGAARFGMGGKPPPPTVSTAPQKRRADVVDTAFMSKPLLNGSLGSDLGEVQKTVWGVGGATSSAGMTLKSSSTPTSASINLLGSDSQRAPAAKRLRPLGSSTMTTAPAAPRASPTPARAAAAPPAPADESGAGLLARLLNKGSESSSGLTSVPEQKALGGSEDLFSYLPPSRPAASSSSLGLGLGEMSRRPASATVNLDEILDLTGSSSASRTAAAPKPGGGLSGSLKNIFSRGSGGGSGGSSAASLLSSGTTSSVGSGGGSSAASLLSSGTTSSVGSGGGLGLGSLGLGLGMPGASAPAAPKTSTAATASGVASLLNRGPGGSRLRQHRSQAEAVDSDSDVPLTSLSLPPPLAPRTGGVATKPPPQKRRRRARVVNDDDDSDFEDNEIL
eukprot:TRINITY_DN7678_c0_g1_i1.p1 TRINITY_DN7678_c0_g1~~TRINITY_DN7678_c0_g1_i1.p1  ORF type:complete len:756 (+),score=191.45 TRINITY_DN7678_c0_g1_i1:128-2269(+)